MNYQELRELKKEFCFLLNERHSNTSKQLLTVETCHKISSEVQMNKCFKRFSNMYRKFRETKFVADLSKGRDTEARFSHVYWVRFKVKEMLVDLQNAPEDKTSVEFTKDERLKVLSGVYKQLEQLEKMIRREIKSSGLVQI